MKQALSALTSSGKYSATTFNLAFYLSNLLKKEFEGEVVEREKESKVNLAPYVEAAAISGEVAAPIFAAAAAEKPTSKVPIAIAAAVALAIVGAGGYFALGSKKAPAPAPEPKVATVVAAAARTPQQIIAEPILASPAPRAATIAGTTGTTTNVDEAAQKKAFEDAVKRKLHEEMMKLQADYTKQLQKQQAKNAPVPVTAAAAAPAPTVTQPEVQSRITAEERISEPSAAQLDLQRQRETPRTAETVAQQLPATTTTHAPPPVVQQTTSAPSTPAIAQIHEGDVIDVTEVDVPPRRTRDPRVPYPPMALRQRIETNVLATVLISETGDVMEVKILRGDDRFGFTDAAVRALRGARYSPAMKDGKRVKTWLPQIIQFKP
jgi:protein TonB